MKTLKAIIGIAIITMTITLLAGCNTTSTIYEYDKDGKVIKKTVTDESVITQVTKSTQNKTVYVWSKGWGAKLNVGSVTTENPSPGVDASIFNLDQGALSIHKDHRDMPKLTEVIKACNASALSVSKDGVSGKSGSATDTTTKQTKEGQEE